MKVRGRRRCMACGERWSYFDTGSVVCPACGSIRSVSVGGDRTLHTDAPVELDLTPARSIVDDRPLTEVAEVARSLAREFVRSRGFVHAGELRPIDDTVLAAAELAYAADHVRRTVAVDESVEAYFLALLAGAEDGERPDEVPAAVRTARGLAAADVVDAYRRDVAKWLDEHPREGVRPALDQLHSHEKRVAAMDGDVPPDEADALVNAARELGRYLGEDDDAALDRALDRLSTLG